MLGLVYANLFLHIFSASMGLIVAWQIKKRSSVLFQAAESGCYATNIVSQYRV